VPSHEAIDAPVAHGFSGSAKPVIWESQAKTAAQAVSRISPIVFPGVYGRQSRQYTTRAQARDRLDGKIVFLSGAASGVSGEIDMANGIDFLALDDAGFMTATALVIDGGCAAQRAPDSVFVSSKVSPSVRSGRTRSTFRLPWQRRHCRQRIR